MASLPATFKRLLKQAAAPYAADGWRPRGAGLVLHAEDGCWGQIVFSGASQEQYQSDSFVRSFLKTKVPGAALWMELTAGTCSPYLMRVVNELDPSKPPPSRFVGAHTRLAWHVPVVFAQTGHFQPEPLDLGNATQAHRHCVLTADTAPDWLIETLATLVPPVQALCSNEAILEWFSARNSYWNLRYGVLLARHLGRDDEQRELEQRAAAAAVEQRERIGYQDRQTTYPQRWSHERFMRFVESVDP